MSPSPSIDLAPGDVFAGRYHIAALLGRGAMGAVYRAHDESVAEDIALKVLALGPEPPPLTVLRLREVVRLWRRATHLAVARVHNLGEHRGHFYLTMELVNGGSLQSVLRAEGRLAPRRAAQIALSLAEGLHAVHEVGLSHGDLTPSNVLFDTAGRVVITDVGIGRDALGQTDLAQGAVEAAKVADIRALGLLLGEMVLGERPAMATLPEALASAATPAMAKVILFCLTPLPREKPSAREVAHLLAHAMTCEGDERPKPRPRSVFPPRVAEIGAASSVPVLAVTPFHYRGPNPGDFVAEAFTDELTDALARLREITVIGSHGAMAREGERDPGVIGGQLGAYAVVEGTVHTIADRVRISVRLVEVASGAHLFRDRFEIARAEAFSAQEAIALRIAEQLRIEVNARTSLSGAPFEAMEMYLDARRRLHAAGHMMSYSSAVVAVGALERCLMLAPGFAPALAAHAVASLRCWYLHTSEGTDRRWPEIASASVARALDAAPDLAESHLAAGMYASQVCDFRAATAELSRALSIAPTCPDALEYLGMLECEAGRAERGARRLRAAYDLDPTLPYGLMYLGRHLAFHGRSEQCDEVLAEMERSCGSDALPLIALRTRLAAWQGDHDALRRWSTADAKGDIARSEALRLYARGVLGDLDQETIERSLKAGSQTVSSPRSRATIAQLGAEIYAGRGAFDMAEVYLLRAVDAALVDLEWMDRCPILAPLRERPAFRDARARVRARAEAIWSGG